MGGILSTCTGCHGAGKNNPIATINDWVVAMSFVDWEGNLQTNTRTSCPPQYLAKVRLNENDPLRKCSSITRTYQ
jgi:hypothetical protein